MIVRANPATGLDQVDQAWFESDAPTNAEAIKEIDAEAARHGLVRTREYWLQRFTSPDGRLVYRGFCYRPPVSDLAERVARKRKDEPEGEPAYQIVREMRGQE
jgi:hypothetical protein